MDASSIAACGVICDLCSGFQRNRNKCVGCNKTGNKPYHCTVCSIKDCSEKNGKENLLCTDCIKFPCKRIRDLDKRYRTKYAESPIQNLRKFQEIGVEEFLLAEKKKWACSQCGNLLCVHKSVCLSCGSPNPYYPNI